MKIVQRMLLSWLMVTALFAAQGLAQTREQLIEGAKKEGQLILSWGTGTMGGIEGAEAMEKAFNKTYGLNLPFKFTPGPAMPQLASRIIQEGKAGHPATSNPFIGSRNQLRRASLKKH